MKDGADTEEKDYPQFPTEFSITNYPNPFNPITTISYGLPESGEISIQIFTSNGRLVSTIFEGYQNDGFHQTRWNSQNAQGAQSASGVYFVQFRFKDQVISRKLLLVR